MRKTKIKESKGKTYYIKRKGIPKGCKYCLKGQKAVLFLNGICQKPDHCAYYCPISKERRGKDLTFADEIQISTKQELLEEIDKINAKGMSITGGEPLLPGNIEKTLDFIKYVKAEKGRKFHVHLYTNGLNFTEEIADALEAAGLDELRFHPPKTQWEKIRLAINKNYSVGAEVPVIPEKEYLETLEKFILYLDQIGAEFINLNEFEICEPNNMALKQRGFHLKKGTVASVEDSQESALELLKKLAPQVSLKLHFCTILAKDYYQLKNRYLRRASTIKLPYEIVSEEGLLIYAQIEGKRESLLKVHELLSSEYQLPPSLLNFDGHLLKLPYDVVLGDEFNTLMNKFKVKAFIIEMIPFRGRYQQITEKIPLKVFKEEYEEIK